MPSWAIENQDQDQDEAMTASHAWSSAVAPLRPREIGRSFKLTSAKVSANVQPPNSFRRLAPWTLSYTLEAPWLYPGVKRPLHRITRACQAPHHSACHHTGPIRQTDGRDRWSRRTRPRGMS